jgi:cytochrome c
MQSKSITRAPRIRAAFFSLGAVLMFQSCGQAWADGDAAAGNGIFQAQCAVCHTGGSIGGGTVTYERNGKQFVAIASGSVSAFFGGSGLPVVVVFALP